jgi:hypothetical protein
MACESGETGEFPPPSPSPPTHFSPTDPALPLPQLRTTTPSQRIIEHAVTDEVILEDEAEDAPDDDDDDSFGSRTYASIISWRQADQLGCVGLLYVILTLILVSGRVMSDGMSFRLIQ